jgi:acylphosphatase
LVTQTCMKCYVSGTVQGVWFRAHTKEEAQRLGLTGFARNLADGRVEVLACGESAQLDLLFEWLKHGPPLAKVTELDREDSPWEHYDGFQVF